MRLAFLSDIHFGKEQDLGAYRFAVSLLKIVQPDTIFLGGDIYDHVAVSSYLKEPKEDLTLQTELDTGFAELSKLRLACPNAKILFYRGNHERRFDKFLYGRAKPLVGLKALNIHNLYRLGEIDIESIEPAKPYKIGHLYLAHGDEFPTGTANPAERALRDMGTNLLFGHIHKVTTSYRRTYKTEVHTAWSNSCLCNLRPNYKLNPFWTQGFTLVDFATRGYFSISPVIFWRETKHRKLSAIIDGKYVKE